MSIEGLQVTKQSIALRQPNGMCQMLDLGMQPDESGVASTILDDGTRVTINFRDRSIVAEGSSAPQITRTYDVGHPVKSGQITEFQLNGIIVPDGNQMLTRVRLNFDQLGVVFPDNQSHLTVRGKGQETVTLF